MKKWKYLFIIAVILYSLYALIPTVRYYRLSPDERRNLPPAKKDKFLNSVVKLGLDLQGGMHLVLEVDDSKLDENAKKDAVDRVIKIIRNRVDQFGVSEPVIQKQGQHRIIVQLPGLQDAERAKTLIGETAKLEMRLVRQSDEVGRVLRDLDLALKGVKVEGTKVDSTTASKAAGETGSATTQPTETASTTAKPEASPLDSLFTPEEQKDLNVPLQRDVAEHPFSAYLVSAYGGAVVVEEQNRAIIDTLLATPQAKRAMPRNSVFLWGAESRPLEGGGTGRLLYLVADKAMLDGRFLTNATTRPNPDDPSTLDVSFQLNREGALIFSRFTGENIGRQIAIVLDGKIRSAPVVQTKIPGGEGRITGNFTDEQASDLAIVLRAGALPAPISIKEERTVGPTLGRDSIVLGVRAAIVGFIVVVLFMVVYYQLSGVLASAALILNLILVLATLAQLHAALTLPGIAGLILTIGMAVDANVLIFERIREELAKAKTVRSAIDAGYERAFTTILDANVTTLITAFVLWQFGTGPIKGFATTLSIGIVASMFTALLVTRVVYDMFTAKRTLKKLSI
jgi:SecD/SecF fusion protein